MSTDSLGLLLKAFRLPTMAEMYEGMVQEAEQRMALYRQHQRYRLEARTKTANPR